VIGFKHEGLKDELLLLPVELLAEVHAFEDWSREQSIKPPFVTCILRSLSENAMAGGVATSLHLRGRAIDFRVIHYDLSSLKLVNAYWLKRKRPGLEVVVKRHGTGPHIHVGLK